MPSPQAEAILQMMKQVRDSLDAIPTLEQQRAGGEHFGALTKPIEGLSGTEVQAGGVSALSIVPDGAASDAHIVYLHGGGYVACSMRTHEALVGHIAQRAGMRALVADYRLAPENPFPAAVDDAVAVYRSLLDDGADPARVVVVGDSAGGGLALALLLRLRELALPQPAGAATMSTYADATLSGETYRTNTESDLLVSAGSAEVSWGFYLGEEGDPKDPLVSPVFASYTDLPPLLLQVGGAECLLDDSQRVAERARLDGVDVTLRVFPDMQHVFQVAAGNMPEADAALDELATWLRARVGLG